MIAPGQIELDSHKKFLYTSLIFLGAIVFSALFIGANLLSNNLLAPRFESTSTPTTWGILQRLYLIVPAVLLSLWRPRQIGFQLGKTFQYWRMLLVMLVLNVGVIAGYLLLTGATPYSGMSMLFNEVVTVPLVEEIVWHGLLFAGLLAALGKFLPEATSGMLAGIFSGVCFGLLHANNILYGYPVAFVAIQTLNATIWGVVYGIARAKTESLYPPILLHAAMNLVVVLV